MKKLVRFICFFICGMMLYSVTALAYIDPSAMTYIIQLVAGVVIAAGAAIGFYFRRVKRAFSKLRKKGKAAENWEYDDEDDDDTGFQDYGIDISVQTEAIGPETPASKSEPKAAETVYAMDEVSSTLPVDEYNETGGEGGLLAENRELRRLLAEERQKVEVLKKSLHICTAPRK